MAIAVNRSLTDALYVPFHQKGRDSALVGTLFMDAEVTGDSSSGTVQISIQMRTQLFGFRPLLVPTKVGTRDVLAQEKIVAIFYASAGNRRLNDNFIENVQALRTNSVNTCILQNNAIPIEGSSREAEATVLGATWPTNTDGFLYHLHLFAAVYDLEVVAARGYVDPMMAGLR